MILCQDKSCAPSPEYCDKGGSSCDEGQISCPDPNGSPMCATQCDQVSECMGGMDENPFMCCDLGGGVMCDTGEGSLECVGGEHVCADDGAQCADGQDEDPNFCCDQVQGLLCDDGQEQLCLSQSQVCADDGAQCSDGRDEDPQFCCQRARGFFCPSTGECIEQVEVCDGVPDCSGGYDESLSVCGCPNPGDIACADGQQCIPNNAWCDGVSTECNDGSDEGVESCGCAYGQVICPDKSCADDFEFCSP